MKLLTPFLIPSLLFKIEALYFFGVHNAHFSQHLILQEQYPYVKYVSNEGSIYCLFLEFLLPWLLWPGGRRESLLRYSLEYHTGFHSLHTLFQNPIPLFLCAVCRVFSARQGLYLHGLPTFRTPECQLTGQCRRGLAKV